jgi:hypothetical protein
VGVRTHRCLGSKYHEITPSNLKSKLHCVQGANRNRAISPRAFVSESTSQLKGFGRVVGDHLNRSLMGRDEGVIVEKPVRHSTP